MRQMRVCDTRVPCRTPAPSTHQAGPRRGGLPTEEPARDTISSTAAPPRFLASSSAPSCSYFLILPPPRVSPVAVAVAAIANILGPSRVSVSRLSLFRPRLSLKPCRAPSCVRPVSRSPAIDDKLLPEPQSALQLTVLDSTSWRPCQSIASQSRRLRAKNFDSSRVYAAPPCCVPAYDTDIRSAADASRRRTSYLAPGPAPGLQPHNLA